MDSGSANYLGMDDTQRRREEELIAQVVHSFDNCGDERLKAVLQALTRHLHAFLREVRPSETEWNAAIEFLTATGKITSAKRQEFILLSDVLGASMQTVTINNQAYENATEASVLGPFFVADSPRIPIGGDIANGASGQPCWVEGTITDTEGRPVPGAQIEVWQADDDGTYDVQYTDGRTAARGHLFSDDNGWYALWALTPTPYPIPYDGPVGKLLRAAGRSPMRAPHLHFMVTAQGCRRLVTHIFVKEGRLLGYDAVFGVRPSLVKEFIVHEDGDPTPGDRDLHGQSWSQARFDIVLAPNHD